MQKWWISVWVFAFIYQIIFIQKKRNDVPSLSSNKNYDIKHKNVVMAAAFLHYCCHVKHCRNFDGFDFFIIIYYKELCNLISVDWVKVETTFYK